MLFAMYEKTEERNQGRSKNGDTACLWNGSLILVKVLILPILGYRFNSIHIKITAKYLVYVHKIILKFIWKVEELG